MALFINNHMTSLRISSSINSSYGQLADSISKLSSGLQIQVAADSPAEFTTSQLMKSNIIALQQGIRNANDGISLVQVADGAMQIIDELTIRMKELAQQASTGTYDSVQRGIIDSEYQQMASEISRIANQTNFNNIKLLDGSLSSDDFNSIIFGDTSGALKIQFGRTNNEHKDFAQVSILSVTSESLGLGNNAEEDSLGFSISTQGAAANALIGIENAITSKAFIRAELGALQSRLETTVDKLEIEALNLQQAESAITSVDVAEEMTNFTIFQMKSDMATSYLAQANSIPNMVLTILK